MKVRIKVSTDNITFKTVGQISPILIEVNYGDTFPFQDLTFAPLDARYVMLEILRYHNFGGGLSEARVFGPPE